MGQYRSPGRRRAVSSAPVFRPDPLPSSMTNPVGPAALAMAPAFRLEHSFVGPRQAVLGEGRDGLEERAADRVVEVLRRQLFLPLAQQARTDVGGELR